MRINDWGSDQKIRPVLFIPALAENEWRYALCLSIFQIRSPNSSRFGLCDPSIIEQFQVPKRVVSRLKRLTFKDEIGVIEVGRWVLQYIDDAGHGVIERPIGKIKYVPLITTMLADQKKWIVSISPEEKFERGKNVT